MSTATQGRGVGHPIHRRYFAEDLVRLRPARERRRQAASQLQGRIDANPLRAFDADHEVTRKVMRDAPTLLDRLDPEDSEHFTAVRELLERNGVAYDLDPTLVRGLDYDTLTVFEFECERLGAQSGVGGGGRYDGLIEQLGGPSTPGCGWAIGVERIALALGDQEARPGTDVFVVAEGDVRERALALVSELRRSGLAADLDLAERAVKGQMKQADRLGARYALILTAGQATLRDMGSGEERQIDPARVAEEIPHTQG